MYILIEGIDGSGKSTLIKELLDLLKKENKAIYIEEVDNNNQYGKLVRETLKDKSVSSQFEALIFAINRLYMCENYIKPYLDSNVIVLSDRGIVSTYVYQGMKNDIYWVKEINKHAIMPDIVFILDLDPKIALERIRKRGLETSKYENEILYKIRERYLHVGDYFDKMNKTLSIFYLDATKSVSELANKCYNEIKKIK
jgi:dTMP kinase